MLHAEILLGDCLQVLGTLEPETFDSMVTDPPAGIAFRGSEWDTHTLDDFENMLTETFSAAYRVLKPGAHILVWSLPRTSYRTAKAIERAGFNIRDSLDNVKDRSAEVRAFVESLTPEQRELLLRASPADAFMLHIFGQGFPKSLSIGKDIDRVKGVQREVVGKIPTQLGTFLLSKEGPGQGGNKPATKSRFTGNKLGGPATEEAAQWEGWGTALKPAIEVWWLAKKPHQEKTIAEQVLKTGTGAINVDGCRISTSDQNPLGRWPANLTIQHGPNCKETVEAWEAWKCAPGCPVAALNEQTGVPTREMSYRRSGEGFFNTFEPDLEALPFFYTGKITGRERKEDLEEEGLINEHPTTKSKRLMRHLVRLVTPLGGRVLDPFAGSGSTIISAIEEGMSGVGIELNEIFYKIASARVTNALERVTDEQFQRDFFETIMSVSDDDP